jgi:molecular chaperone GrpE
MTSEPRPRAAARPESQEIDGEADSHVDTDLEADLEAVLDADASTDGSPEQSERHDLDELTTRAEKADEYLLLAQRTQADFENYRKRAARDAALAQERGIAKLAKELLPAVDNLDRALAAAVTYASVSADTDADGAEAADGDDAQAVLAADQQLVSGLRLVHAEVLAALARVGIEPFSPVGEQFDPQHHEAVAQQPFEGQASGTVVEVYQQGFRFGESVLRPARVLVAA